MTLFFNPLNGLIPFRRNPISQLFIDISLPRSLTRRNKGAPGLARATQTHEHRRQLSPRSRERRAAVPARRGPDRADRGFRRYGGGRAVLARARARRCLGDPLSALRSAGHMAAPCGRQQGHQPLFVIGFDAAGQPLFLWSPAARAGADHASRALAPHASFKIGRCRGISPAPLAKPTCAACYAIRASRSVLPPHCQPETGAASPIRSPACRGSCRPRTRSGRRRAGATGHQPPAIRWPRTGSASQKPGASLSAGGEHGRHRPPLSQLSALKAAHAGGALTNVFGSVAVFVRQARRIGSPMAGR